MSTTQIHTCCTGTSPGLEPKMVEWWVQQLVQAWQLQAEL